MEETAIKTRVATVDRFSSASVITPGERAKENQKNDRLAEFFDDTARFGARLAVSVAPEGSTTQKVLFAIPGLGDLLKVAQAFFYASLDRAMRDGIKSVEEGRKRRSEEEQIRLQEAHQSRKTTEEANARRKAQSEDAQADAQAIQAERAQQHRNVQAT